MAHDCNDPWCDPCVELAAELTRLRKFEEWAKKAISVMKAGLPSYVYIELIESYPEVGP